MVKQGENDVENNMLSFFIKEEIKTKLIEMYALRASFFQENEF